VLQTLFTPFLHACTSQTTVNQVCKNNEYGPGEGTIRYRLRDLDTNGVQHSLNQMLKDNVLETLPRRDLAFAIDFVLIPFYGAEQNKGDTHKDLKQDKAPHVSLLMHLYT